MDKNIFKMIIYHWKANENFFQKILYYKWELDGIKWYVKLMDLIHSSSEIKKFNLFKSKEVSF